MFDVESVSIKGCDLNSFVDVLPFAWRSAFRCDPNDQNKIVTLRDYALIKLASIEDELSCLDVTIDLEWSRFNVLNIERVKCLLVIFDRYHHGQYDINSVENHIDHLATLGEFLALELAEKELKKLLPERKQESREVGLKHRKRGLFILQAKEFSRHLTDGIMREGVTSYPYTYSDFAPIANVESLRIENVQEWIRIVELFRAPSDEKIFESFIEGFRDISHSGNKIFKAVDKVAQFSGVSSINALHRSLSQWRNSLK